MRALTPLSFLLALLAILLLAFVGCQSTPPENDPPPDETPPVVAPPPDQGQPPPRLDTPVVRPGEPIALGRALEGTVLGPGKASFVVGASVTVRDSRSRVVAAPTTDETGRFSTQALSPDRYELTIEDPEGRFFPQTLTDVDPTRGPIEVELERAYYVMGVVVEQRSQRSARGVRVVARSLPDGEEVGSALSGGEGAYRIGPLAPGRYEVLADQPGGSSMEAQVLDDLVQIDLTIPDVIYVNGLVTRSTGPSSSPTPLEGALVTVEDKGGKQVTTTTTNQSGIFTLAAPPPGSYMVRVTEAGGEGHGAAMCVVPEEGEPSPLRILVEGPASIVGHVEFPVSLAEEKDVRVWLLASERAMEPLQVAYPRDGEYRFPRGVSPGTYTVRAFIFLPSGEVEKQHTITVTPDEVREVDFEFR
jgi:hypothetical protein